MTIEHSTTAAAGPPDSGPSLRWAILGTGAIAHQFADDLHHHPGHTVAAVGSREPRRATMFAARHGILGVGSYGEVVSRRDIDAVYIATPNSEHHPHAALAVRAGKAVLVEKPFTLTADNARNLADLAKEHGSFLMEAMWTRFLPHTQALTSALRRGVVGDLQMLTFTAGLNFADNPGGRAFDPRLGGGAIYDLGIYALSLSSMLVGPPETITAVGVIGRSGVDEVTSAILTHPGGVLTSLCTTLRADTDNRASIIGTEGRIDISADFWAPTSITTTPSGKPAERIYPEVVGSGLTYQADEVARCLAMNLTQSRLMPVPESIAVIATAEEILRQMHLR